MTPGQPGTSSPVIFAASSSSRPLPPKPPTRSNRYSEGHSTEDMCAIVWILFTYKWDSYTRKPCISWFWRIPLGSPWFVQHDPIISWRTGEVLKWGSTCFPDCSPHIPLPSLHPETLCQLHFHREPSRKTIR